MAPVRQEPLLTSTGGGRERQRDSPPGTQEQSRGPKRRALSRAPNPGDWNLRSSRGARPGETDRQTGLAVLGRAPLCGSCCLPSLLSPPTPPTWCSGPFMPSAQEEGLQVSPQALWPPWPWCHYGQSSPLGKKPGVCMQGLQIGMTLMPAGGGGGEQLSQGTDRPEPKHRDRQHD